MNKAILIGRLTADPEVRETRDGKRVANFTLAIDRIRGKGEKAADFVKVTAWESRADFAARWLAKGRKVAVSGRIETGTYTAQDGSKRNSFGVVADEIEFAENRRDDAPEHDYNPSGYVADDDCPF
jgi:single-strand DNA-binding protein